MKAVKLLVVTRFLPAPDSHGACVYLHDILLYLRERKWEIECVYLNEAPAGESLAFAIPDAVKEIVRLESPGNVRFGGRLVRFRGIGATFRKRMRRSGPPSAGNGAGHSHGGVDRPPSEREISFARRRVRRFEPDVVLADFAFLAGALPGRENGRLPVRAILTHDVLHERVSNFKEFGLRSAWSAWTEESERELLGRADLVVAISEEEALSLRRMTRDAGTEVVVAPMSSRLPNGVREPASEAQVPGRCLFVGGSDAHNAHGLKWFLSEVWPRVLARRPAASLDVCGGVRAEIEGEFPRVSFLGHVPDLGREYAQAEVCVVPILAGSGIKIKLVEALSHGRACVTTPQGLRGLGFIREGLLVAENAEEFAEGVADILSDPSLRRKLERDGARAGFERLSPEKCYGPFARAIERLLEAC